MDYEDSQAHSPAEVEELDAMKAEETARHAPHPIFAQLLDEWKSAQLDRLVMAEMEAREAREDVRFGRVPRVTLDEDYDPPRRVMDDDAV